MRVQTYAIWVHRHEAQRDDHASAQPLDDLIGFINGLIAQMTYYPSFMMQITPNSGGLWVEQTQRVLHMDEQQDGMVALRTDGRKLWITRADYHRLLA
jgi:hypothetical protein